MPTTTIYHPSKQDYAWAEQRVAEIKQQAEAETPESIHVQYGYVMGYLAGELARLKCELRESSPSKP